MIFRFKKMSKGINHPISYGIQVYKIRRVKGTKVDQLDNANGIEINHDKHLANTLF